MKVSEAKTKVCPFMSRGQIIQGIEDGYSVSSYNDINYVNCICDECMAWEWEEFMYDPALLNNRESLIEMCKNRKISFQNNDSSEKLSAKLFSYENREGYCKRLGK